ncbi:MAG: ABC transporter permease [bacterium]|nr:ABC transporter permease [bacterium]
MSARLLLFRRLILRALAREKARTALTVLAVSLGVAVVVAIELAGTAAAGSFRSSLETLTGDADYEIAAIGGLDERLLGRLARLPYPFQFSPRVEGFAALGRRRGSVTVVGLDLVAQQVLREHGGKNRFEDSVEEVRGGQAVWVGQGLGHEAGDELRLTINDRSASYRVRGVLPSMGQENVVLIDIGAAQQALGRMGKLDRIEVRLPERGSADEWQRILRTELPQDAELRPRGARTEENRKMLAAFRWNLRVLSYIALVVGAFLIYNTIAISVVRRRGEIGILRALGATRPRVVSAFLAEAVFFGVAGGVTGLLVGRVMAEGAVQMLGATVRSLYVSSTPAPIELTAQICVMAVSIGVTVSLASALAPALEAARVAPVEAMARGRRDYQARVRVWRDMTLGLALAAFAGLASTLPPVGGKPVFGYAAALLLIAAGAMLIPAVVMAASRLWRHAMRTVLGIEAMLASRSLAASLGRTAVLVGALSTAVAMMVAVGIMVGSFRETVVLWLDHQLRADLYLRPAGGGGANLHPTMSPAVPDAIETLPGVAAVDRFRSYDISYNGMPALLGSGQTEIIQRYGRTRFLDGVDREQVLRELPRGDNAIVSEPFANKHGIKPGDVVSLPLGGGVREFRVLGVYFDYSNERGYIMVDRGVLRKYLPDAAPSGVAIYLEPGADRDQIRRAVEEAVGRHQVMVTSNQRLRVRAMEVFDRTFAITYALEAVAIVVAVMRIAGALLALVIDRRREMAVLRFLGAASGQIRRLILFEAGLLGLLSNLVGFSLGYVLSLVLIYVINKQSFGWTIQFHWPVTLLVGALTLIYAATVLAGLYPARVAVRLNPIEVAHEE